MKILITGGHFAPAFAVIEELKKDNTIVFVGRKYALEGDSSESFEFITISQLGIPFYNLKTGRVQRKFTKHTIPSLLKIPSGILEAYFLIKKINPDIVLTFGGYVGFPISIASFFLKIPIVLHEQTQDAGLSNKIISHFADKICISFATSRKYFPESKTILTGNPVRKEIFEYDNELNIPKNLKIIYITGGSTGSHFINSLVFDNLPKLLGKYIVIHQTGESGEFQDFKKLKIYKESLAPELRKRYILKKFISISEIGWIYKNSSLVVARSGINTICEILALSKRCLLIPLPHGQSLEQLKNSILVKKSGLGDYIEQNKMDNDLFIQKINFMLENEKLYKKNKTINNNTISEAGNRLANVLKSMYEKKSKEEI